MKREPLEAPRKELFRGVPAKAKAQTEESQRILPGKRKHTMTSPVNSHYRTFLKHRVAKVFYRIFRKFYDTPQLMRTAQMLIDAGLMTETGELGPRYHAHIKSLGKGESR
jgi:hypothetical protein